MKRLIAAVALTGLAAGCSLSIDSRPSSPATPDPRPATPASSSSTHAIGDLIEARLERRASRAAHRRALIAHARQVAAARAARAAAAARVARAAAARLLSSAYAWAHSAFAIRVANCESGGGPSDHSGTYDGDPHLRDRSYHGKWQMDADFWASYGGLRFAGDAADATEAEQDYVAWRGWRARGWSPWTCAGMV